MGAGFGIKLMDYFFRLNLAKKDLFSVELEAVTTSARLSLLPMNRLHEAIPATIIAEKLTHNPSGCENSSARES